MICPKCKKEIEDGSLFCDNCGTRLSEDNLQTKDAGEKTTDRSNIIKRLSASLLEKTKAVDQEHIKPFREKLMARIGQNKKVYAYSAIALVVTVIVVAGAIYLNNPVRKIERLYNNGEYKKARSVYSETIAQEQNTNKRRTLNNELKDFFC
jgi:uncharacterized membrane protein YvbJ